MFFLVRNPFVTHQSERLILAGSGIRRQGVSYAYFAVHKFQYLQGSPLGSSCEVDKARDCALACVNNPPCSSFNLGLLLTAKGKLQCELLPEDKYRNAGKIFHSQQFHHYSIKVNINPIVSYTHGLAHATGVHERNTVPYARFALKKRHGFCAKAREKNMQRHRLGTL